MALLFDYHVEHPPSSPVFCSDTLRITARLLQTHSPTLAQTLSQLLIQYDRSLPRSKKPEEKSYINNAQLLSDLGAIHIHQIITSLIAIGNHELVANTESNQALLSSLKQIISQWSDFGEWIVQLNQDLY